MYDENVKHLSTCPDQGLSLQVFGEVSLRDRGRILKPCSTLPEGEAEQGSDAVLYQFKGFLGLPGGLNLSIFSAFV